MLLITVILFVCMTLSFNIMVFFNLHLKVGSEPSNDEVGTPLFLTPYIEAGKIKEGQSASRVTLPGTNVTSYAGYLTVNKTYNSNMFFWFFPSEVDPQKAPVVLWLQGGPGRSSLYGLFWENGPFSVDEQLELKTRQYYWSQVSNVIYIDNPVGTGFSFTEDDAGYAENEVSVGRDLYSALRQFFELFPQLQKNDFFVTGESYAGKYVPALAYTIHNNNKDSLERSSTVLINLKGIAIGNGFTDPENMMGYADFLYQIGLVDQVGREKVRQGQNKVVEDIRRKEFDNANIDFGYLLGNISRMVGKDMNFYNYLTKKLTANETDELEAYVNTSILRRSIHVGKLNFNENTLVQRHLSNEYMKSVKPWVETLLENGYRILFYNGELDIICAYSLTVSFLQKLQWRGAEAYKTATRKQWMVGQDLAGYSKTVDGFTELMVRNAGHMVPMDQPKWALDMINRFVHNQQF